MYARMNTARWNPDRREEAMKLTQDTIIPAYQDHPGFEGYILLTEPRATRASRSRCGTRGEQGVEHRDRPAHDRGAKGILAEPPLTENFEVTIKV